MNKNIGTEGNNDSQRMDDFLAAKFWETTPAHKNAHWFHEMDVQSVLDYCQTATLPHLDESDEGIAHALISLSKGRVLYTGREASDTVFHVFDGTLWRQDDTNQDYSSLRQRWIDVCKFCAFLAGIAVIEQTSQAFGLAGFVGVRNQPEAALREKFFTDFSRQLAFPKSLEKALQKTPLLENEEWLRLYQTARAIIAKLKSNAGEKNVRHRFRMDPRVKCSIESFDPPSDRFLPLQNGILDLHNQTLLENGIDFRFTQRADVAFDPDATCPNFEHWVGEYMEQDPDRIEYLQRALGSMLVGSKKGRCIFNFGATAGNGKSTIMDTMVKLMGGLATSLSPRDLFGGNGNSEYSYAKLKGKRLVLVNEAERPYKAKDANSMMIKQLVDSGKVQGREIYGAPFDFDMVGTLFINTNHDPATFIPQEQGIQRRVALLEWNYKINPKDMIDDFASTTLYPEFSGILNWLIKGARAYAEKGLRMPESLEQVMQKHMQEEDHYFNFMNQCLIKTNNAKDRIKLSELLDVYLAWYQKHVCKSAPTPKNSTFKSELKRIEFDVKTGTGNANYVMGVKFPNGFHLASPHDLELLIEQGTSVFGSKSPRTLFNQSHEEGVVVPISRAC